MTTLRLSRFAPVLLFVVACTSSLKNTGAQEAQLHLLDGANHYQTGPAPVTLDSITFTSAGPWSASIAYQDGEDWISLEPRSGHEAGTYTVKASLLGNYSGADRSAVVLIHCGNAAGIKLTVRQESLPRIRTQALAVTSPKLGTQNANPLLDCLFCADPTAVEYGGRLYVYGTNDQQQYLESDSNTFEKIRTLVMMSTDDMVNWTFHGEIPVGEIAPWISASWAPSVVVSKREDGSPLFTLFFSNSGWGVGVLQAGSPTGPWTSPLDGSLIDGNDATVKDSGKIFDPGAVIDAAGTGWLAFGGTQGWLARLNPDMHSFAGVPVRLPSPFHFEANELNCIGGTFVYTYNNDWSDHSPWTWGGTAPGRCSMVCFKSTDPADGDSWTYGGMYFKNPGYNGFGYGNNHTHLHKFQDKWYLFYHTNLLQSAFGTDGGFRSLYVDEIAVDEQQAVISECIPTHEGVAALKNLDPYVRQSAATAAATQGIVFQATEETGRMSAAVGTPSRTAALPGYGIIEVRNVDFGATGAGSLQCRLKGEGLFSIRLDDVQGPDAALRTGGSAAWTDESLDCFSVITGIHTLYFVMEEGVGMDTWKFSE